MASKFDTGRNRTEPIFRSLECSILLIAISLANAPNRAGLDAPEIFIRVDKTGDSL